MGLKGKDLVKTETFVGKTIQALEHPGVNCLVIVFTDGTKVTLETEYVGHSITAIVQVPNE